MLKLAGALCVVAGAAGLALSALGRLRERRETLGELAEALTFLAEELSFRLAPLPPLLEELSRRGETQTARFFGAVLRRLREAPDQGLRGAWALALERELPSLRDGERTILAALGGTLGQYDGEGQRLALRQAVERLEPIRAQAAAEQGRLGRVYAALCLAGGLATVIVLI